MLKRLARGCVVNTDEHCGFCEIANLSYVAIPKALDKLLLADHIGPR